MQIVFTTLTWSSYRPSMNLLGAPIGRGHHLARIHAIQPPSVDYETLIKGRILADQDCIHLGKIDEFDGPKP
jgi:hypothetical protein